MGFNSKTRTREGLPPERKKEKRRKREEAKRKKEKRKRKKTRKKSERFKRETREKGKDCHPPETVSTQSSTRTEDGLS